MVNFLSLVLVVIFAMSFVTSVSAAEFEVTATHICDAEHNHDVETASGDLQITPFAAICGACDFEISYVYIENPKTGKLVKTMVCGCYGG